MQVVFSQFPWAGVSSCGASRRTAQSATRLRHDLRAMRRQLTAGIVKSPKPAGLHASTYGRCVTMLLERSGASHQLFHVNVHRHDSTVLPAAATCLKSAQSHAVAATECGRDPSLARVDALRHVLCGRTCTLGLAVRGLPCRHPPHRRRAAGLPPASTGAVRRGSGTSPSSTLNRCRACCACCTKAVKAGLLSSGPIVTAARRAAARRVTAAAQLSLRTSGWQLRSSTCGSVGTAGGEGSGMRLIRIRWFVKCDS